MKKIGTQKLFLATSEKNLRNGEGTFARLSNGSVMYAYTQYGASWDDHATARLCACRSFDEGESWSAPELLIEKDERAENIMSASLFNLANGDLGIVYLRKMKYDDGNIVCMPVFRSSSDLGKSWSDPVFCIEQEGYYCVVNDSVTVEPNGRILVPMSFCGKKIAPNGTCAERGENQKSSDGYLAYSDDNGKTWQTMAVFYSPYDDPKGLGEPGIFVHENGDYWIYFRTPYGFQYFSRSLDGGKSWTPLAPQLCFTSPDAPMRVKKVGKYVAAVFNPIPYNCTSDSLEVWKSQKRTPLVCALCKNDARSFAMNNETLANGELDGFKQSTYFLEDDKSNSYCYPAILEVADGFLVAYYHSNGTPVCLNSCKITKVYFYEI
jgi:hypothetical protein